MASVYAEGHQDVGRGVEQHNLETEMRGGAWLQEVRDGTSWEGGRFVQFRNLGTEPSAGWGLAWGEGRLTPLDLGLLILVLKFAPLVVTAENLPVLTCSLIHWASRRLHISGSVPLSACAWCIYLGLTFKANLIFSATIDIPELLETEVHLLFISVRCRVMMIEEFWFQEALVLVWIIYHHLSWHCQRSPFLIHFSSRAVLYGRSLGFLFFYSVFY